MSKRWDRRSQLIRGLVGIALVVLALAVIWSLFVPVADWLARHDVGSVTGSLHETAVDNARGRLLTLGAGLFAVGALLFTARNFILSREGQVTERYTKAIEQLGSDKLDVRIGGIYALERVARDSAKDHPTVMEVLTAFIREHSREPWPTREPGNPEQPRSTRPDVQAAATVVGRRDAKRDTSYYPVDLTRANLPAAILIGANLTHSRLDAVDLTDADLVGAHLDHAHLSDANLTRADLLTADLSHAILRGADLTDAYINSAILIDTHLRGANLTGADLTGAGLASADLTRARVSLADLTRASLKSATLHSANLSGTLLTGADLTGAHLAEADLTGLTLDLTNAR
jgi:uncharacterized protein YjbI with pentapeptide repeats